MRFFLFLFITGAIWSSPAVGQQSSLTKGYYVIVGAFANKNNAIRYNERLHRDEISSSYSFVPSRNLYYVFTVTDQDASKCIEVVRSLRKQAKFADAWVRYIDENGDEQHQPETDQPEPAPQITPQEQVTVKEEVVEPELNDGIVVTDNEPIVVPDKVTLGNTEVFLSLYNARNDRVVDGNIQVIDTDRARELDEVKGNTYLILPNPKNTSGKLTLIADVIGYRKVQKEINFTNPLSDTSVIEEMGTQLVVNFDLIPYEKGDIRTLFNIYFYNEAAVMMPESKFELNGLLAMMRDNPNYRIRLHGHTNGNYHGKIIRRASGGDFFSVTQDAVTTQGSAKELSESRAEAIKDYLVENGIDVSRIEVKAWGGKRPIYDKNSANAKKNIRVEVEIL